MSGVAGGAKPDRQKTGSIEHFHSVVFHGTPKGVYTVELYARVRRAVVVDKMSEREAAKEFGLARETVRKMLRYSVPPGYRRQQPVRRPKLDASISFGTTGSEGVFRVQFPTQDWIVRPTAGFNTRPIIRQPTTLTQGTPPGSPRR